MTSWRATWQKINKSNNYLSILYHLRVIQANEKSWLNQRAASRQELFFLRLWGSFRKHPLSRLFRYCLLPLAATWQRFLKFSLHYKPKFHHLLLAKFSLLGHSKFNFFLLHSMKALSHSVFPYSQSEWTSQNICLTSQMASTIHLFKAWAAGKLQSGSFICFFLPLLHPPLGH